MPKHSLFVFILSLLLLSSCASETPTAGEAKDFSTACDKANNGTRVAVTGYLRLPDSNTGTTSIMLRLYQAEDFTGAPIGVDTPMGTQANQVEQLKESYAYSDMKVHLANGSVSTLGDKVRVSGKVYFPLVGQDFGCGLENPLVELAR